MTLSDTRKPPQYPIESVNNALILIQLLRDLGSIRVADATKELGVSPSTAHRLLSMLVYRNFAVQDEQRVYHAGPGLGQSPISQQWVRRLRDIAKLEMQQLTDRVGHTSNLLIRSGAQVRFLLTVLSVESDSIGDRQGVVLPAVYSAGGRAILADLPDEEREIFLRGEQISRSGGSLNSRERARARSELNKVRFAGYARNLNDTELGLSAFAVPIRDSSGRAIAAVALALHSTNLSDSQTPQFIHELQERRDAIEQAYR